MKHLFLIFLLLTNCAKAKDEYEPTTPDVSSVADYRDISESVRDSFTFGGYGVVSRKGNGDPEHLGEALIWGGTYLWASPCETSRSVSESMAAMIDTHDGAMIRVDPLGEYEGGREVTFDGATGAFLGISRRITDCDETDLWSVPFAKLVAFQNANKDRLHQNVESKLFGEFKYLRDLIASRLGLRDRPDTSRLRDMEKLVSGWALAVKLAHATGQGSDACFRVNLGLSSLVAVETLGESISANGRNSFCENTKGMGIPTVDHWCGRENMSEYLASYDPTQYEYRHQRCGEPWEHPDGDGNNSHQLDKIMAYAFLYGWSNLQ